MTRSIRAEDGTILNSDYIVTLRVQSRPTVTKAWRVYARMVNGDDVEIAAVDSQAEANSIISDLIPESLNVSRLIFRLNEKRKFENDLG